jgi:hypothetical protein
MHYVFDRVNDPKAFQGHVAATAAFFAHPGVFERMAGVHSWLRVAKGINLFRCGMIDRESQGYAGQLKWWASQAYRNTTPELRAIMWGLQVMAVARATGVGPADRHYRHWENAARRFGTDLKADPATINLDWPNLFLRLREELHTIRRVPPVQVKAYWATIYDPRSPLMQGDRIEVEPAVVLSWVRSHLPSSHLADAMRSTFDRTER